VRAGELVQTGGILNEGEAQNPLANWSVVHVPYCDGSLFVGDIDRTLPDDDGREAPALQRGLLNLTAALEVAKKVFPHPRRVVLAGTSAGAYGGALTVALARRFYPDRPLVLLLDSGGLVGNERDPAFVERALGELNAGRLIPASCEHCFGEGHLTDLLEWTARRDPSLHIGYTGHARDYVIGSLFLHGSSDEFERALRRESAVLSDALGGRFTRFITTGEGHTFLLGVNLPTDTQRLAIAMFGSLFVEGTGHLDYDKRRLWFGSLDERLELPDGQQLSGYTWLRALLEGRPIDAVAVETASLERATPSEPAKGVAAPAAQPSR
jgi:hypothetical protein